MAELSTFSLGSRPPSSKSVASYLHKAQQHESRIQQEQEQKPKQRQQQQQPLSSAASESAPNINKNRIGRIVSTSSINVDEMSYNFDDDGDDDEYDISSLPLLDQTIYRTYQFRAMVGAVVNHNGVQLFVVLLILFNSIMMGVATFDFVYNDPHISYVFNQINLGCLIIFTIEIVCQLIFYGHRLFFNGWHVFDVTVITISWAFYDYAIIRAFRIFNALRLITRVRTMKNLLIALFAVMPRMFAIAALLCIIMYIFSVMFTELYGNLYADGYTGDVDYFGTLTQSFFTLFQIMTLDGWADLTRLMEQEKQFAWVPVITFLIIAAFVMANLIIAVICDAIRALHDTDKAKLHGQDPNLVKNEDPHAQDENDEPIIQMQRQIDRLENLINELTRMENKSMMAFESFVSYGESNDNSNNNNNNLNADGNNNISTHSLKNRNINLSVNDSNITYSNSNMSMNNQMNFNTRQGSVSVLH